MSVAFKASMNVIRNYVVVVDKVTSKIFLITIELLGVRLIALRERTVQITKLLHYVVKYQHPMLHLTFEGCTHRILINFHSGL